MLKLSRLWKIVVFPFLNEALIVLNGISYKEMEVIR